MNRKEMSQEPERDALVGAALRWVEGEAPVEEVDWETLRSNVRTRAAFALARRRNEQRRRSRWLRPLVPLAAAASIALAVWVGTVDRAGPEVASEEAAAGAPQLTLEEALLADLSEQEFRSLVSGRSDSDELLMIAVSGN